MAEYQKIPDDDDLDPTILNDIDGDGDTTNYGTPLNTFSSTTRPIDIDEEEEEDGRESQTLLDTRMKDQDEAWANIRSRFPKVDTSKFTAGLNKFKQVVVKLIRKGSKPYVLFKGDDELNDELPTTIKTALGVDSITLITRNDELVTQLNEANEKIKDLSNVVVGLKETIEVYPQEIDRYVAKEKDMREFIEKQQVEIAENKSYLDAAVKQNIEVKRV